MHLCPEACFCNWVLHLLRGILMRIFIFVNNPKFCHQSFEEWRVARREELSEYQKQISEQYLANVEKDLERWQNRRKARKGNDDALNLQETMDKELDTHRLEHGPKKRKIPSGGDNDNDDEDDVEDINAGEDDMMDDVLGVDENNGRVEEGVKTEAGDSSLQPDIEGQQ